MFFFSFSLGTISSDLTLRGVQSDRQQEHILSGMSEI